MGKIVHELLVSRRLVTVKQIAIMVPGWINEFFLKLALFNIHDTCQGRKLIILRLPQAKSTSPTMTVRLDEDGETCVG